MTRTDHCVKITHGLHGSHPSRQHRYVFKVVIVKMRSVPLHRTDPLVITIPLSDLNQGTNRIAVETHLNYLAAPSVSFEFSAEVVMP